MLHKSVIEQKSGFKPINDLDLAAVSGGAEIVVIGNRGSSGFGFGGGGGGGGGGNPNGISPHPMIIQADDTGGGGGGSSAAASDDFDGCDAADALNTFSAGLGFYAGVVSIAGASTFVGAPVLGTIGLAAGTVAGAAQLGSLIVGGINDCHESG